jgi:transposase InsO family protein
MTYISNPRIERVRMEAARMVLSGRSTVETARHFGYSQSVIVKWVQRARLMPQNAHIIPTRSSRPYHHPNELSRDMISRIIEYRQRYRRCAFFLHHMLLKDGHLVSLSSIKRVLKRCEMSRFSKWKKWHTYPPRPVAERPGLLVEIDTVHDGPHDDRLYVYTMIDVCSRIAYVTPELHISTYRSLKFVRQAREILPFSVQTIQSDHGPEFSKWFTKQIVHDGMAHRHSRVRTPNDNAHLERFNRTIREECLDRIPRSLKSWQKEIPDYLRYYNEERPHMGIQMKTPIEIIKAIPRY